MPGPYPLPSFNESFIGEATCGERLQRRQHSIHRRRPGNDRMHMIRSRVDGEQERTARTTRRSYGILDSCPSGPIKRSRAELELRTVSLDPCRPCPQTWRIERIVPPIYRAALIPVEPGAVAGPREEVAGGLARKASAHGVGARWSPGRSLGSRLRLGRLTRSPQGTSRTSSCFRCPPQRGCGG
jgi:hypothetical protein